MNTYISNEATEETEEWLAGHLHYHENLNNAVVQWIQPVVSNLIGRSYLKNFFFVRSSLGGPHLRLRLQVPMDRKHETLDFIRTEAEDFLRNQPSKKSASEETVRRMTDVIVQNDPHEEDDTVYPDNLFRTASFKPEIERYGGQAFYRPSLSFATFSAIAALQFLAEHLQTSRETQLAFAMRLLILQTAGSASDRAEFTDLIRYGEDSWGESCPKILEKADRVAESQRDFFVHLFSESLSKAQVLLSRKEEPQNATECLILGANELSRILEPKDRYARARILGSQLHMTASRIGLGNVEEVYLSRIMTSSWGELLRQEPNQQLWIDNPHSPTSIQSGSLDQLLPRAVAWLGGKQSSLRSVK